MKKSTTMRSLLLCGLSMLLCFSMLAGTTFAWFTDSVESGANQIVAGNLDVELYNSIGAVDGKEITASTPLFQLEAPNLWEPGMAVYENFTVANEGNLALKYQLGVNIGNASTNEDGDTLAEVLKVAVVENGITETDRDALINSIDADAWMSFESFIKSGKLEEDETKTYGIVIWWEPSDIDNAFNMNNGKTGVMSIEIGVKLFATQAVADDEKDSFGTDYDKDAWMDAMQVLTADDLQSAINSGETAIILMDDIVLDEPIEIPAAAASTYSLRNAGVVINLNGNTITAGLKSEGRHHYAIDNYGTVTITGNGTIEARGIQNFGTMTIDGDITITDIDTNGGAAIWNEGTLTINNGTFKAVASDSTGGAALINKGGKVTVNGGVFEAYAKRTYAVVSQHGGELTINNATVTGVHGCVGGNNTNDSVITVNGGNYTLLDNPGVSDHCLYMVTAVYGGSFKAESLDLGGQIFYDTTIVPGYKAENVDGTWVVSAAIKSGDDLQAAIENAEDGETITLVQDIVFTTGVNGHGISVTGDKNFTLDLNGHTVTSNLGNNALRFKIGDGNSVKDTEVTITVKNGKVVSESANWCAISATATNGNKLILNLENLDVEANKAGDFAIKSWEGAVINANDVRVKTVNAGGFYAVGGEIVLDNCTVDQNGPVVGYLSVALGISNGGKMTVNSGSYKSTAIEGADASRGMWVAYIMSSGGTLNINGGTFNAVVAETANASNACGLICADKAAVVNINGGTFNSNGAILDMRNNVGTLPNPTATISGGTFTADPTVSGLYSSNLIKVAEGYSVVENADGTYSVK